MANVLPFWAMPDAIRRWENILKHCRRILDNFPASLSANYISGSNFTISWPIIFAANVLPFCAVPKAIRRWENVLEYSRRILDNFPSSLSSNYISSNNFTVFWAVIFCCWFIAILGGPKDNPGMGKLPKPLLMHFGWFSRKHICKIHFWQQFHCLFCCCVCCQCVAILCSAEGNPGVGKHLETLPMHFG